MVFVVLARVAGAERCETKRRVVEAFAVLLGVLPTMRSNSVFTLHVPELSTTPPRRNKSIPGNVAPQFSVRTLSARCYVCFTSPEWACVCAVTFKKPRT